MELLSDSLESLLKFLFDIINRNVTPFVLAVLQAVELPGLHLWPVRFLVPVIGIVQVGEQAI